MKKLISIFVVLVVFTVSIFAQGFKVKATSTQTFNFEDKAGRNQTTFFSSTMLEDITGLSGGVNGNVTFNIGDLKTLKGKFMVPVATISTGIEMRDKHMLDEGWLNGEKYPEITFEIKSVNDIKAIADNKINAKVTGNYTMKGITKEVIANTTLTYLDESDVTKSRAPGDLLGVQAKFDIKLSDFGINNKVIGQKVADIIEINVNMVGSNAK